MALLLRGLGDETGYGIWDGSLEQGAAERGDGRGGGTMGSRDGMGVWEGNREGGEAEPVSPQPNLRLTSHPFLIPTQNVAVDWTGRGSLALAMGKDDGNQGW